jgi:hypothetical protein
MIERLTRHARRRSQRPAVGAGADLPRARHHLERQLGVPGHSPASGAASGLLRAVLPRVTIDPMRGVPRPRDSETSATRARSGASTRPRGSRPISSPRRDLVDDILDAAPEVDELTAVAIARGLERERAVSARAVADHLGLRKTDWVYANAERLGGRRLGEGQGARWRFYLSEVDERLRDDRTGQRTRLRRGLGSRVRPRRPTRRPASRAPGPCSAGHRKGADAPRASPPR